MNVKYVSNWKIYWYRNKQILTIIYISNILLKYLSRFGYELDTSIMNAE